MLGSMGALLLDLDHGHGSPPILWRVISSRLDQMRHVFCGLPKRPPRLNLTR